MRLQTAILLVPLSTLSVAQPSVLDGDIIFHTSRSSQSKAIQLATHSKYSHMGMILWRDGKPYVFEAVQPVKYTPLQDWINRGDGAHYVVKRLKNRATVLTPDRLNRLRELATSFLGKSYDLTFEWSDDRMYCSEIVWKLYERACGVKVGKLLRLRDFDLTAPAVKAKMKERYKSAIPMNELVISPQAMFDSELLEIVNQH